MLLYLNCNEIQHTIQGLTFSTKGTNGPKTNIQTFVRPQPKKVVFGGELQSSVVSPYMQPPVCPFVYNPFLGQDILFELKGIETWLQAQITCVCVERCPFEHFGRTRFRNLSYFALKRFSCHLYIGKLDCSECRFLFPHF